MSQISPKQELFCSLHNQNTIQHNRRVKRNTLFSLSPHFFWTVMHKPVQNKTVYTLIHNITSNNPSDRFSSTYFLQCQRVTKCANISEKSYPSSIKNSRHVGLPCIIILHLSTINYSTIIKH